MSSILMGFVGDVLVNRDNPSEPFAKIRDALKTPAIMFANLEGAYTDDPHLAPSQTAMISGAARNLDIFHDVGFNVMSLANNHILDVGSAAMLENRTRLRKQGVQTCGAGDNIDDARVPAIMEVEGLRIAFLAYSSVFPYGYEAGVDTAGLVPMRAYDHWRVPMPRTHMPGAAPVGFTVPDSGDMEQLAADIRRARERVDLVIASFHWGDQTRPFYLSDHELRTGRYAIDCGADMVVGHHQHAIRGMEWYKEKPIIYGLGHFVFDFKLGMTEEQLEKMLRSIAPGGYWEEAPYAVAPRKGWPYLPMHEDTRLTMVAWATADRNGVSEIGFLPCKLRADGSVDPLPVGGAESDALLDYFAKCNAAYRFNGRAVAESSVSLGGHRTVRVVAAPDGERVQ